MNNKNTSIFDKNTIIGLVLIFAVMFGFSYLNRPSQEQIEAQRRYNDSIAEVSRLQAEEENKRIREEAHTAEIEAELHDDMNPDSIRSQRMMDAFGDFSRSAEGEEKLITLENEQLILKLSTKGGRIYSAQIKGYNDYKDFDEGNETPIYLFDGDESSFGVSFYMYDAKAISTANFFFEAIQDNPLQTTMRLHANTGGYLDFVYTIHEDDYLVDFKIVPNNLEQVFAPTTQNLSLQWEQKIRQQEKGRSFEDRYAYLAYKFLGDDVEKLKESKSEEKNIPTKLKWIGYKDQFFSSVLIAQNSFDIAKLTTLRYDNGTYLKDLKSVSNVAFNPANPEGIDFTFFFGPNKYSLLKEYDKNQFEGQDLQLEKLVPMGWSWLRPFNKYIIIPIFDWLTGFNIPLGLAIFLLTLIIKLGLFPLTYKSLISSAKMRVLKPQVEEITAKFPGQEQAMQRQQKTMELYKQVGVSPMAGCWPMLIQMPFLLALFWFFPTAIELRHEGFLWAKDLSTYDSLISWKASLPIIGNHISLFCLLMSAMTIVSQKITMATTNAGQQAMPGMNMMMYLMPVFMFFFLNSYPAGLNYYYLVSTLITLVLTFGSRLFINEDKLLAKLEKNKKDSAKKPKKKSGFMARLEEAQRQQQAQLKQQKKGKK
jgi:membrane protein insertase, YidC/Oxa1 family, N-terminal domain